MSRVLATLNVASRGVRAGEFPRLAFADSAHSAGTASACSRPSRRRILQTLELGKSDAVLEVGTGTGFLTACLAALAVVRSLEIYPDLAALATRNLPCAGINGVSVETLDAWRIDRVGRYDAIVVSGHGRPMTPGSERALKAGAVSSRSLASRR